MLMGIPKIKTVGLLLMMGFLIGTDYHLGAKVTKRLLNLIKRYEPKEKVLTESKFGIVKSALVIGATGLVGYFLTHILLNSSEYNKITVLIRKSFFDANPKLNQIVFDFEDINSFDLLEPVDDLYCCLGTTIKTAGTKEKFRYVDEVLPIRFADWAKKNKVNSFSIVTAMGANEQSSIFYNRIKGTVERKLIEIGFPILAIFRPSILMGKRKDFRIGEIIGKLFMKLLSPLMIGPMRKYAPIYGKKVAQTMVNVISNSQNGIHIIKSDKIYRLSD